MTGPITVVIDPPLEDDSSTVFESKAFQYVHDQAILAQQINEAVTAFNLNSTNSTSSTSWTISDTGSQTFDIDLDKSYVIGMSVKVALTYDASNWAIGDVINASSGAVTISFREKRGSGTSSDWTLSQNMSLSRDSITRSDRTSDMFISLGDRSKLINITSGSFTQTFDSAIVLGIGWYCWIKNSGTGDITLDPSGTETIDGLSGFVMFPGEHRLIMSDGSNLLSVVISPFFRRITSTYTNMPIPPGYKRFKIRAWSAGASGQRTNSASTISVGGAGGGCVEADLPASSFSTTETVTIGAGGNQVTTVANGNPGGDTSFGSILISYAGNSWVQGGSCFDGFIGISTNNAELVYAGANGITPAVIPTIYGGSSSSSDASANAANSLFGSGCGGSLNASAVVRTPGISTFGGNGGPAASASNGTAGTQPGGGGGATQTGTQSGAGANGEVHFWGIV